MNKKVVWSLGVLLCAGLFVVQARGSSTDCVKDLDLEKELGVKFDKVVEGSDSPPSAEEVTSRGLSGLLHVQNRTSKTLWIWVREGQSFPALPRGPAFPNLPFATPVVDIMGKTYLKACTAMTGGTCYTKTISDTLQFNYTWTIQ